MRREIYLMQDTLINKIYDVKINNSLYHLFLRGYLLFLKNI